MGRKLGRDVDFLEAAGDYFKSFQGDDYELVTGGFMSVKEWNMFSKDSNTKEAKDAVRAAVIGFYLKRFGLFQVVPIGLTMEQIEAYELPPNPAKVTDPRAKKYVEQFGRISWEVDALKPEVLSSIVEENIERIIDMELYFQTMEREKIDLEEIQDLIDAQE